jgi:hypothetical protein
MDSKKTTKKTASKKNGNSKKVTKGVTASQLKKADAELKANAAKKNAKVKQPEVPQEGAYTVEGPIAQGAVSKLFEDTPGPRFLFSIPSQHTGDNDYEHLVIAKSAQQAAALLADARITEKQPQLVEEPEARKQLLFFATKGYLDRGPKKIEPREEPIGVLQINHHKAGLSSPELN